MIKKFKQFMDDNISENIQTELVVDVIEKDEEFINKLIDKLSFIYKKRKDRHVRPIKINGDMSSNINLNILLSNKDLIKFEYINNDELKIHINNKLLYHDDTISDSINKLYDVYIKYLNQQNFKINKKHPF